MSLTSIGDQSRLFVTRRMTTQLRKQLERLAQEVSSGKRHAIGTPVGGDTAQVLAIRRETTALSGYRTAATEARLATGAAQTALGRVGAAATEAGPGLVAAALSRDTPQIQSAASDARARFLSTVSALNAEIAGATLFAGTAIDGPALAGGTEILAAVEAAVAGQSSAAGIETTLRSWFFAVGGGFETFAYLGNATTTNYRIGPGEDITLPVTAADPALRNTLFGLALAAVAPALANVSQQADVMERAGTTLIDAGAAVVQLRAGLGVVEARVEQRAARVAAEISALQMAEADLLGVDPYESSVALDAAATRLETLHMVTARLARLTLAEYLR